MGDSARWYKGSKVEGELVLRWAFVSLRIWPHGKNKSRLLLLGSFRTSVAVSVDMDAGAATSLARYTTVGTTTGSRDAGKAAMDHSDLDMGGCRYVPSHEIYPALASSYPTTMRGQLPLLRTARGLRLLLRPTPPPSYVCTQCRAIQISAAPSTETPKAGGADAFGALETRDPAGMPRH